MPFTIMSKLMQGLPIEPAEFAQVLCLVVAARRALECLRESQIQTVFDSYELEYEDVKFAADGLQQALEHFPTGTDQCHT